MRVITTFACLFLVSPVALKVPSEVFNERNRLVRAELSEILGSDIVLSDNEIKANTLIMELKLHELDTAFTNARSCMLAKHFFRYKEEVKERELFKIIQKMPKGAILHVHDTGILSPDYVLSLTYLDNLFVCFEDTTVRFLFSAATPTDTCATAWQLMRDARYSSGNVEAFDADLKKHFTIVRDNYEALYPDVDAVWSAFQTYFIETSSLFTYKPVWEKYFYDTLAAVRADNVMYLEIRSVLPVLYDLDGNVYDSVATAESYKKVVDQFVQAHPDFFGAKLIYAPLRRVDAGTVREYLKTAREIKRRLPEFFAGFDLVGQEDKGTPTKEFLPALAEHAEEFDYFFHAGETNWQGMSSDENIFDAIALGSKRLGHAFAIAKHPLLIKEVKKRDIALEVNVLSNAVLGLVSDVRNHPLASFLVQGIPVVLSSDDPGVWEAEPLTHDFYVAFVGVASRHADIRMLKKLALNSLHYSTIPNKDKALREFEIRWTKFIEDLIREESVLRDDL